MFPGQPEMCHCHVLPVHPSLYSVATGGTWRHCIIYNLSCGCVSLHYSSLFITRLVVAGQVPRAVCQENALNGEGVRLYARLSRSRSRLDMSGVLFRLPEGRFGPSSQSDILSVSSLTLEVEPRALSSAALATLTQRPSTCTDSSHSTLSLPLHPGLL